MDFTVLTLFPEIFEPFIGTGMMRKAVEDGIISASAVNIRDYAEGRHRVCDDKPYGGGCGMVMKPEPTAAAIRAARELHPESKTVLMTPQGRPFTQAAAAELATLPGLIFVCGRYEGVDERIYRDFIDDEISMGDYVLTGGELPAMTIIDAVMRLLPGVLGGEESAEKDSFSGHLLEHAHYTRPFAFEGAEVPEILLSGDHGKIERWRTETALKRTFLKRPDLLLDRAASREEKEILKKWCLELGKIIKA